MSLNRPRINLLFTDRDSDKMTLYLNRSYCTSVISFRYPSISIENVTQFVIGYESYAFTELTEITVIEYGSLMDVIRM